MQPVQPHLEFNEIIQVDCVDRWHVYHRLEQLAIPCLYQYGQPLRVSVHDAVTAIQLWSVLRQVMASRQDHLNWLARCWQGSV